MDLKDRRERIARLQSELARSTSPEVTWMRELWDLQLEDARDRLVEAEGLDFPRVQGEARYLEKFTKQMHAASALLRRRD